MLKTFPNPFQLCFLLGGLLTTACWLWGADDCPPVEDCRVPYCVIKPVKKPIKKVIYCLKRIPYCPHGMPCPCDGNGCDYCPKCSACPCYRHVLLKKEIVIGETWEKKCVIEYPHACQPDHPVEEAPPPKQKTSSPTARRDTGTKLR